MSRDLPWQCRATGFTFCANMYCLLYEANRYCTAVVGRTMSCRNERTTRSPKRKFAGQSSTPAARRKVARKESDRSIQHVTGRVETAHIIGDLAPTSPLNSATPSPTRAASVRHRSNLPHLTAMSRKVVIGAPQQQQQQQCLQYINGGDGRRVQTEPCDLCKISACSNKLKLTCASQAAAVRLTGTTPPAVLLPPAALVPPAVVPRIDLPSDARLSPALYLIGVV